MTLSFCSFWLKGLSLYWTSKFQKTSGRISLSSAWREIGANRTKCSTFECSSRPSSVVASNISCSRTSQNSRGIPTYSRWQFLLSSFYSSEDQVELHFPPFSLDPNSFKSALDPYIFSQLFLSCFLFVPICRFIEQLQPGRKNRLSWIKFLQSCQVPTRARIPTREKEKESTSRHLLIFRSSMPSHAISGAREK